MKLALAGALMLALSAPVATSVPSGQTGIPSTAHPEVLRVDCIASAGTAFRTSPHRAITVAHVIENGGCFIEGEPFTVLYRWHDFAILELPKPGKWMRLDCDGFVPGRTYVARGYARGRKTLTDVQITATKERWLSISGNLVVFNDIFTVIPGQSGGPIIDPATGKAVGTVNLYDSRGGRSAGMSLKDTVACP
jgi:hypothetical protein